MICKTIHDLVYEEVAPMLQKADNPGGAMRDWIIKENLDPKDLREVCVALAIGYKNSFDFCNQLKGRRNGNDT